MADDYKYKNLPRAANGIAPAYWDEEEKQWLPYEGGADMVKELNDIKATQAKILERLDKPLDTQVTGSNVEVIFSETDFVCPANSYKRLDYVDISDFKEFYIHYVPGGLSDYGIHYYLRRPNDSVLLRDVVMERNSSSNGMTDRFNMNSISAAVSIHNKTEEDHAFSEIYLFGVKS